MTNNSQKVRFFREHIPSFECKPGCHDCCGPVTTSTEEMAMLPVKSDAQHAAASIAGNTRNAIRERAATVALLHELFYEQTRDGALVWQQNPVTLEPQSEPQPDLTLLKFRADRYAHALPTAADVLLIVEVSDTTLDYDRGEKLRLYARHGIPEYWIVDPEIDVPSLAVAPALV
jgi:hypothetical protein